MAAAFVAGAVGVATVTWGAEAEAGADGNPSVGPRKMLVVF